MRHRCGGAYRCTCRRPAMQTSRSQLDRLLDPSNPDLALHTLFRAAAVLGKKLKVELVDRAERR